MEKLVPKIDKSKWPQGPWLTEPDRVDFEYQGFPCLALRNWRMGNWCGYVAVPPKHPLWEISYSECGRRLFVKLGGLKVKFRPGKKSCNDSYCDHTPSSVLNVHGGLTYSDHCRHDVCHIPKPGEADNVWWFGFDCAHSEDYVPGMMALLQESIGKPNLFPWAIYRDLNYVTRQIRQLADQLAEVK